MENQMIKELWHNICEKMAVERARLAAIRFRIEMREAKRESNGQPG